MKVAFMTLGCRVNQYETNAIREKLFAHGFEETAFENKADVYVINTCAVTGESARKSRQMIRRALRQKEKDPGVLVCAAGCFTQGEGEENFNLLQKADLVFGNTEKGRIADEIIKRIENKNKERSSFLRDISHERRYEPLVLSTSKNARAFVKIQDGCDSFCSYCFVPLVRGRSRSREESEILEEVRRLVTNGYSELVFTGIETGFYGVDLFGTCRLAELIRKVALIPGVSRIRFGSLKPTVFTEDFCHNLSSVDKVMPHFHLSFQSGSDAVLSAMNRRYGYAEEILCVELIRRYFPDAGLSADFICGFPGETEEDFFKSLKLVKDAGLLHTHIFPFSKRKGTPAAKMPCQVPDEVKKARCAALFEAARSCSENFARPRKGKTYGVLCERIDGEKMYGYTENFIYTETPAKPGVEVGKVYPIRLTERFRFVAETMIVQGEFV